MSWPSYPTYKSSGVSWLGHLPAEWTTAPCWTLFRRTKKLGHPELELLSVYRDHGVLPKASRSDNFNKPSEDLSQYQRVDPGSLVVNKMKAWQGSVSVSEYAGIVSPAYFVYEALSKDNDLRFLHYILRSTLLVAQYASHSYGVRPNQWDLDPQAFSRLPIPLPPTSEQVRIAKFLDRETAKIDALIGKQEQLIATLREDRAATITQAVTKGLDSRGGISSSGDQGPPSHWAQGVPLKRLAEVQTGLTLGRSVSPETAVTIPYLRVANVQVGRVDLTEVTEVAIDRSEVARYRLRAGDVLMTEGGDIDKLGRGCLWQGEIDPCLHQNHVFAVRCSENLDARFLVYLLDTAPAREYFTLTAKKTTNLASTNSTTLGRFSFPVPPIAEQKAIVRFLDERCSKIDALIGKSTEMIETLREYRSALITNAVTGKIDVREGV